MGYRFIKDVIGLKVTESEIKQQNITVRGTADHKGKTMSFADDKSRLMLTVPLEPFLKELKNMLKEG